MGFKILAFVYLMCWIIVNIHLSQIKFESANQQNTVCIVMMTVSTRWIRIGYWLTVEILTKEGEEWCDSGSWLASQGSDVQAEAEVEAEAPEP